MVAQTKGRGPLLSQAKGETCWSLAHLSAPRVCSPVVELLHKNGPRYRRMISANSLWLYFYYTQSSPSKNKNINYIFIYLRVLRPGFEFGSLCQFPIPVTVNQRTQMYVCMYVRMYVCIYLSMFRQYLFLRIFFQR